MPTVTIEQIDALLPQTQCGLCEYAGCKPYATAMINDQEAINRCPPGGVETLKALADVFKQDATPFIEDMLAKQKSISTVVIREDECIGCTKCIQACPVDAIIGGPKLMHTVIQDQCSGCDLCIEPCPVDCIDIVPLPMLSAEVKQQKANQYRTRFLQREARLASEQILQQQKHQKAKIQGDRQNVVDARKQQIQEAIARKKAKNKENST